MSPALCAFAPDPRRRRSATAVAAHSRRAGPLQARKREAIRRGSPGSLSSASAVAPRPIPSPASAVAPRTIPCAVRSSKPSRAAECAPPAAHREQSIARRPVPDATKDWVSATRLALRPQPEQAKEFCRVRAPEAVRRRSLTFRSRQLPDHPCCSASRAAWQPSKPAEQHQNNSLQFRAVADHVIHRRWRQEAIITRRILGKQPGLPLAALQKLFGLFDFFQPALRALEQRVQIVRALTRRRLGLRS